MSISDRFKFLRELGLSGSIQQNNSDQVDDSKLGVILCSLTNVLETSLLPFQWSKGTNSE